jgi:hypothetical protein
MGFCQKQNSNLGSIARRFFFSRKWAMPDFDDDVLVRVGEEVLGDF